MFHCHMSANHNHQHLFLKSKRYHRDLSLHAADNLDAVIVLVDSENFTGCINCDFNWIIKLSSGRT